MPRERFICHPIALIAAGFSNFLKFVIKVAEFGEIQTLVLGKSCGHDNASIVDYVQIPVITQFRLNTFQIHIFNFAAGVFISSAERFESIDCICFQGLRQNLIANFYKFVCTNNIFTGLTNHEVEILLKLTLGSSVIRPRQEG